jgi:hypothetical protein
METPNVPCQNEVKILTSRGIGHAHTVLGFTGTNSWALSECMLHNCLSPYCCHGVETLEQLCLKTSEHPPYSLNLAVRFCVWTLKDALRSHHSTSNYGLKEAVRMWLATQSKTHFSDDIHQPLECWTKHIKKWCTCMYCCSVNFNEHNTDTY